MERIVDGIRVLCSAEEIAERIAEEAEWEAEASMRAIAAVERASGMTRRQRDVAIAALPSGHYWRKKAEEAEAAIVALGIRREG